MNRYVDAVGEVSPSVSGVNRAAAIVAALAPPPDLGADQVAAVKPAEPSPGEAVKSIVPGLAAGAVGACAWKKHRVLGFLAGHAVGSNASAIVAGVGAERKAAWCRLGVEGSGVAGSLMWKRHPIFGWVAGIVVGSAATWLVADSPLTTQYKKLFKSESK